MKKAIVTIAIVLGLGMTAIADPNGGGLFQRGIVADEEYYGMGYGRDVTNLPMLPVHGSDENNDAEGPIGSGLAVLATLGAAYFIAKKRKEE